MLAVKILSHLHLYTYDTLPQPGAPTFGTAQCWAVTVAPLQAVDLLVAAQLSADLLAASESELGAVA